MNEIERAIELLKQLRDTGYVLSDKILKEIINTSIVCMQSELDRQENKALTVEELKEMVGEPVWIQYGNITECVVIRKITYQVIHFTDATTYDTSRGNATLYKHKPNGG